MDIKVRIDVPASSHPGILSPLAEALEVEGTVGKRAIAAGREALATVYTTYGAIEDAEKALQAAAPAALIRQAPNGQSEFLGDIRMVGGTPRRFHGHEDELAAASEAALMRATLTIDRRYAELTSYLEKLQQSVAEAIDDKYRKTPEGLSIAASVRDHVKGLGDKKLQFVFDAVRNNDKRTVSAVLSAPAYLSGLKDKNLETLRDMAARQWAPVDHAQFGAVEKILEYIRNAGNALTARIVKTKQLANTPKARANAKLGELAGGK